LRVAKMLKGQHAHFWTHDMLHAKFVEHAVLKSPEHVIPKIKT